MRALLDKLGISAKYKGYRMLIYAIEIAAEDDTAVSMITKRIYPRIAQEYDLSPVNVEKNIRMAISAFWTHGNRDLYDKIVGYPITQKPSNAEFIGAISSYVIRTKEYKR